MPVAKKPVVEFDSAAQWREWLSAQPSSEGVRVRLRKKSTTLPGITYAEALDVALCFGWIDGQLEPVDDQYFRRVFTPRRRNSVWSKVNREHVERLTRDGLMTPAGLAEVERAKQDGRWDAAYRQSDDDVPADLQAELDRRPSAAAAFANLKKSERFSIVFRVNAVKRPETRARKIAQYVELLDAGALSVPPVADEWAARPEAGSVSGI